jgi:hypothetical protein
MMIPMPPSEEVREHDYREQAWLIREWPLLCDRLMSESAKDLVEQLECSFRKDYGAECVNDHLVPLTRQQAEEFFGLGLIAELDSRRRMTYNIRRLTESECPECQRDSRRTDDGFMT